MTKLTLDLEYLKPLIDQAKETQRNIEQIYSGSRGYLRIANTQSGQDATQLETAYKRSIDQLGNIVSVLQTTYNAIRELQSDEGARSTGTGNPWSRWFTGQSGYGDPVISYVSSTRQVVEGVWNWFRVPPPVSQMMEQMKNNAVLASGTKSIQELADTNAFGIRLRGQFETYNQELFGWMQDLGRAYSKGGQSEVAKRVEQIKEIAMQAYESLAPYTEYVRYFNESSSQEDEYAQTKNEDPGGHHVLGALQSFASGAWNAGASAISNGIYHDTTNKGDSNLAYTAGEIAGGLAAAGIGVIETIEGISGASAGIVASPETAGVAAVIIAPSLAVAALGVTTIGNGVSKIADGVHNFSSEGMGDALDSVPSVRNGEFNKWFNSLTPDEFDKVWADPKLRDIIKDRLRHPGGLHEWHLVSRADVFKRWGVSSEQIAEMRTLISETKFVNPKGKHGGKGSTTAHNELLDIIDSSTDYDMFKRRLQNWANYRFDGGVDALPNGLKP
jgi:hypothetical protein